jgi:hypothetical protein
VVAVTLTLALAHGAGCRVSDAPGGSSAETAGGGARQSSSMAAGGGAQASSGAGATGGAAASGGTGAAAGTDAGGGPGGAPPSSVLCVSSPVPAPFAGSDDCPAPQPAAPDTLDEALAVGGVDRCHVRFLPEDVSRSTWPTEVLFDKHRLPDFTPLHRGPLRLPAYARETRGWLDAAITSKAPVSDTLAALSVRRGHALHEVCLDLAAFEPQPSDPTPLATAVLLLDQHLGMVGDGAALRAAAAPLPLELQRRLARVLGAVDHAVAEVRLALGAATPGELQHLAQSYALYVPTLPSWDLSAAGIARLDAVDVDRIVDAAALLARTVEDADFGALPDTHFAAFEAPTPIGAVVVHDASADHYLAGSAADGALLLFDLGGDDTYEVPAGASDEDRPVSVAIDVRGADRYGYAPEPDSADTGLLPSDGEGRYHSPTTPDQDWGPVTLSHTARQGAGLAGIGLLFDLGPESDHYRSLALSQGFAAAGVGVLYDAGGDDVYEAEIAAQGAATFGVAALIDRAGNDTYQSFTESQGFGGAEGAGALVDGAGDDVYAVDVGDPARGGHPLYYAGQLPGVSNDSLSQGAAQGRRPLDDGDASYMAGGLGVLYDRQGNDRYTGSVFAQGVGYWQGLGMLLEGGGDDRYDALWYLQGSAAHFALAVFLEAGGDDSYDLGVTAVATGIGVGHDFSAALHLDEGGDDHYRAPPLGLGSGNANGIGCLVNVGGDDVFESSGDPTLGAGNYSGELPFGWARQDAPTIGVFVHVGGVATYAVSAVARPLGDTTWSYTPQPYPPPELVTTEHGCGADRPGGAASMP